MCAEMTRRKKRERITTGFACLGFRLMYARWGANGMCVCQILDRVRQPDGPRLSPIEVFAAGEQWRRGRVLLFDPHFR